MSDTARSGRRWWLRMLAVSVGVAGLLLAASYAAPVARLHFHAWKFRTGRDVDGASLAHVADWAVKRRLPRDTVVGLLGRPAVDGSGRLDYQVLGRYLNINKVVQNAGFGIVLAEGCAVDVEESVPLPLGALDIDQWGVVSIYHFLSSSRWGPTRYTHRRIGKMLNSDKTTAEKLEGLKPYVKIDSDALAAERNLGPPTDIDGHGPGFYNHTYDDSGLTLAFYPDGKCYAIGFYPNSTDGEARRLTWLVMPACVTWPRNSGDPSPSR
jgi:hypothetical protein